MDGAWTTMRAMAVLVTAALLVPALVSAELDETSWRCRARAAQQEAHLLACAASCARRSERWATDAAAHCFDACVERHAGARAPLDCATERVALAELVDTDAHTLRCRAQAKRADVRGLRCLAVCQQRDPLGDDAADATSKTIRQSREACELACQARPVREPSCLPTDALVAGERHAVEPGGDPSGHVATAPTAVATVRGFVPLPGGAVETDLDVVDGEAVFEGDIVIGTVEDVLAPPARSWDQPGDPAPLGAGRRLATFRWPARLLGGATVPFTIDPRSRRRVASPMPSPIATLT